ncbi:MAG: hypothetical protein ACOC96_10000 [Actinomycetota bacterium]
MGTVAVVGAQALIQGYVLAGARPLVAESAEQARAQWAGLASDVLVVILTPAAAEALSAERAEPGGPMAVVMPE